MAAEPQNRGVSHLNNAVIDRFALPGRPGYPRRVVHVGKNEGEGRDDGGLKVWNCGQQRPGEYLGLVLSMFVI